jgi:hypothetical protein
MADTWVVHGMNCTALPQKRGSASKIMSNQRGKQ